MTTGSAAEARACRMKSSAPFMSSRDQCTVSPVFALNPEIRKSSGLRRIAGQSGAIRRSSTRASGPKMYLALKNPSPRRNGRIPPNSGSPGKTVK